MPATRPAPEVRYALSEEQQLLRDTARRFLEDRCPSERVRELMLADAGFDRSLWEGTAQLGWQGLAIDERHGGSGYGFAELAVVLEETGRALLPAPLVASSVLAATAIAEAGDDEQQGRWLPGIASGEIVATLAARGDARAAGRDGLTVNVGGSGSERTLDGVARFVFWGTVADLLVVAASDGEGTALAVVPADAGGVTVTAVPALDPTRRLAEVRFDQVAVAADAWLTREPAAAFDHALALGRVALAAEQVGVAQRCLELTVAYAKTRHQFGRPIGSFQAVKHTCADMLTAAEHARSTMLHAARTVGDREEFAIAAPLAAAMCSDAAVKVTGDAIQLHGGIGFTWEHDAHLYFKRAKSTALLLGTAADHRRRLAEALGL